MAGSVTKPTVLANLAQGSQNLSLIDGDIDPLYTALNALATFSNYYVDTGGVNNYIVSVPAPQVVSLQAGLIIVFKAAFNNSGASMLTVGTTPSANLVNPDGSALSPNQIIANAMVTAVYDGTNYQLQSITTATQPSTIVPTAYLSQTMGVF